MSLYLDEISFNVASRDDTKKVYDLISGAIARGFPPGVAVPWVSNEEPKIILVLDIQDHALTFSAFAGAIAQGVVSRRRLAPIVEWSAFEKFVKDA
jgi:hypothetical protein